MLQQLNWVWPSAPEIRTSCPYKRRRISSIPHHILYINSYPTNLQILLKCLPSPCSAWFFWSVGSSGCPPSRILSPIRMQLMLVNTSNSVFFPTFWKTCWIMFFLIWPQLLTTWKSTPWLDQFLEAEWSVAAGTGCGGRWSARNADTESPLPVGGLELGNK